MNLSFSEITLFSLDPVKIITSVEVGVALTNSDELARKMALLRNHGISRDAQDMARILCRP